MVFDSKLLCRYLGQGTLPSSYIDNVYLNIVFNAITYVYMEHFGKENFTSKLIFHKDITHQAITFCSWDLTSFGFIMKKEMTK